MSKDAEMPSKTLPLTLIVAATATNGIGKANALPWRLKEEMRYFARVTSRAPEGTRNAVIMGRKSWEGIPKKFRPLKDRRNVVISRGNGRGLGIEDAEDSHLVNSLPAACSLAASSTTLHRAFLIGGAQLYTHALATASASGGEYSADRILLTRVLSLAFADCDAFFPEIRPDVDSSSPWERRSHAELSEWAGEDVPEGEVAEGEVRYRFEMWTRRA